MGWWGGKGAARGGRALSLRLIFLSPCLPACLPLIFSFSLRPSVPPSLMPSFPPSHSLVLSFSLPL